MLPWKLDESDYFDCNWHDLIMLIQCQKNIKRIAIYIYNMILINNVSKQMPCVNKSSLPYFLSVVVVIVAAAVVYY